jgi:hypothetical protein
LEQKKSRLLIAFAVIVALILLASAYYWIQPPKEPQQIDGVVDHKSIGGIKDDTGYTLVMFTPHGLNIDPSVIDLFAGQDINMTISSELEKELEQRGYKVHYVGNIRLDSPDDYNEIDSGSTLGYFLPSRDDFNRLAIGSNVTIEVSRDQKATIKRVL